MSPHPQSHFALNFTLSSTSPHPQSHLILNHTFTSITPHPQSYLTSISPRSQPHLTLNLIAPPISSHLQPQLTLNLILPSKLPHLNHIYLTSISSHIQSHLIFNLTSSQSHFPSISPDPQYYFTLHLISPASLLRSQFQLVLNLISSSISPQRQNHLTSIRSHFTLYLTSLSISPPLNLISSQSHFILI